MSPLSRSSKKRNLRSNACKQKLIKLSSYACSKLRKRSEGIFMSASERNVSNSSVMLRRDAARPNKKP